MKAKFLLGLFFLAGIGSLAAQNRCGSFQYGKRILDNNPSLSSSHQRIGNFIQSRLSQRPVVTYNSRPASTPVIKIPVVIHIVYHLPVENIPDEAIQNQMKALKRDYRRMNEDSVNTPSYFKPFAADCNIEFELAKVDPQGRATNGIERIYSPVANWFNDDQVKHKSQFGANGWDAGSYLNIWVCNMNDLLGYSSIIGEADALDGVVINYSVFNDLNDGGAYNCGRTAVHEIGHWLGLKHIWGDADCGDDGVADTPEQSNFTSGCPRGTHISCGNASTGDMYMNFMDYTNDPCMNLFTKGQSDRMRALFEEGGARHSILLSKALGEPYAAQIPGIDSLPENKRADVYPNPAAGLLMLDFKNADKWLGQEIKIMTVNGQVLLRHTITSKTDKIDISSLGRGLYFIYGTVNGERLSLNFLKL